MRRCDSVLAMRIKWCPVPRDLYNVWSRSVFGTCNALQPIRRRGSVVEGAGS